MKIAKRLFLMIINILVFILWFSPITSAQPPQIITAYVSDVPQINQLKLNTGLTINLYGLQDEHYDVNNKPIFDDYKNGIELIKKMTLGKSIRIQLITNTQYIVLLDDLCLNEIIVKHGYDFVSKVLSGSDIDTSLILAQDEAKSSNIGIWNQVSQTESHGKLIFNKLNLWWIPLIILFSTFSYYKALQKKQKSTPYLILLLTIANAELFAGLFYYSSLTILILIIETLVNITMVIYMITRNISFWQTIMRLIAVISIIIIMFGSIYWSISMSQPDILSSRLIIAKGQYLDPSVSEPKQDYLDIPIDYYSVSKNSNGEPSIKDYNLQLMDTLYFSATTFFTVGYGDITPKGNLRIIAMFEMIIGYLLQTFFIAILVKRFEPKDIMSEDLPSKIKTFFIKHFSISFFILWLYVIYFYRFLRPYSSNLKKS